MRDLAVISCGDRIAAGEYLLHSRFRQAVTFTRGENLLSFVTPGIGAGPLNVVISETNSLDCDRVIVRGDAIQIGDVHFPLQAGNRFDSAVEIPPELDAQTLDRGITLLRQALQDCSPPESLFHLLDCEPATNPSPSFKNALASQFHNGLQLLREGRFIEGADGIKGLGHGLTPGGDDFLAGLLIALNLRRLLFRQDTAAVIEHVFRASGSGNVFSTAFLRCARDGRVFERMKETLNAVFMADRERVLSSTKRLSAIGATSGTDIAAGLIFGMELSDTFP